MQWKFELLMKPSGELAHRRPGVGRRASSTSRTSGRAASCATTRRAARSRSGAPAPTAPTASPSTRRGGSSAAARAGARSCASIPTARTSIIADRVDGKKLNTPNDLAIDRKGRIWFTNPVNEGNWDKTEVEELDHRSVLRADPQPDGSYTVTRVTFDTTQPNGILVSQDQSTLYVAESSYAQGIARELRAYPIREDGSLGTYDDAIHLGRGRAAACIAASTACASTPTATSSRPPAGR